MLSREDQAAAVELANRLVRVVRDWTGEETRSDSVILTGLAVAAGEFIAATDEDIRPGAYEAYCLAVAKRANAIMRTGMAPLTGQTNQRKPC